MSTSSRDGTRTIGPDSKGEGAAAIDPKFLIKAGLLTILAAAVCAYAALCLLFYQGQWQLVLHPSKAVAVPQHIFAHEDVHFFPSSSGEPQIQGWLVAPPPDSAYANEYILYVPDGSGAMSSRVPKLQNLHALGRTLFTFDYRGFGNSAKMHPSQQSMQEDAVAAIQYLTETRHVAANRIALYASGSGAVAATYAATQKTDICCLVLDNPEPDMMSTFKSDSRTKLLPLHLLLKSDFNLIPLVQQAPQPKLIFSTAGTKQGQNEAHAVFDAASGRKTFVDLYTLDALDKSLVATRAFLDQELKP